MVTIYDSTRRVKSTRLKPFAVGLTPPEESEAVAPSAADLAWAAVALNIEATDYDVIEAPALAPVPAAAAPPRSRGVRLDPEEEAASRFGIPANEDGVPHGIEAGSFMHRADAEIDQDWAEYDRWSAQMSRWVDRDEPGPQPY